MDSSKLFLRNDDKSNVIDRSFGKFVNQNAIVSSVRKDPGISKAQLAKELGISKPAISSNVEELLELGVLLECGKGNAGSKGGRKPVMLQFNENNRYVGALDLSFREPVCAIGNLNHEILGLERIQSGRNESPDQRREQIKNAFLKILNDKNIEAAKLDTIVISQPGIISEDIDSHYAKPKHHQWTELQLKDYLYAELGTHVSIRNDVNLAALGELNFGIGSDKKVDSLLYVSCGVGIGAGIIINNELYTGQANAAGEIGSMITHDGSCLEDGVAMDGLLKRIKEASDIQENIDFNALLKMLSDGNKSAKEQVRLVGKELGMVIYNLCIMLDIRTVMFGGEYLELGDDLFSGMESMIPQNSIFKPEILQSKLQNVAGLYGCFVIGSEKAVFRSIAN